MLYRIITLSIMLTLSCSLFAKSPRWLSDVSKVCKKKELCAVGEGINRRKAEQNARAGLAKIFQNEITSSFKSKLSSTGSTTYEEMSEEIMESTQMALEGVEIKEVFEDKTSFYALASMNKRKAANSFEREIKKLDEQMEVYAEDPSGSTMVKLEKAYIKRESLAKNFEFLTNRKIPLKISFEEIFKKKKAIMSKIVVYISLDEESPKSLEGVVIELLSGAGYKTVVNQDMKSKSTHSVTGKLVAKKKYMNVGGFEKYEMTIDLSAKKSSGVETGHLNHSVVEVGRDYKQAYSKGVDTIKEYLEENLAELNIE